MLWKTKKSIDHFDKKEAKDFFLSEKEMLKKINYKIRTILDFGCASGRFIEVLESRFKNFEYTGYDIVKEQIINAKSRYPKHKFFCKDIKLIRYKEKFDLVNAAGIILHEPIFENIIDIMIKASKQYILFDVKFANIKEHILNISESYSAIDQFKLPYIIFNPLKFLSYLEKLKFINSIHIYGYQTKINKFTKIPNAIKNLYSANILLKKSNSPELKKKIEIEFHHANIKYNSFFFLDK